MIAHSRRLLKLNPAKHITADQPNDFCRGVDFSNLILHISKEIKRLKYFFGSFYVILVFLALPYM